MQRHVHACELHVNACKSMNMHAKAYKRMCKACKSMSKPCEGMLKHCVDCPLAVLLYVTESSAIAMRSARAPLAARPRLGWAEQSLNRAHAKMQGTPKGA